MTSAERDRIHFPCPSECSKDKVTHRTAAAAQQHAAVVPARWRVGGDTKTNTELGFMVTVSWLERPTAAPTDGFGFVNERGCMRVSEHTSGADCGVIVQLCELNKTLTTKNIYDSLAENQVSVRGDTHL